MSDHKERGIIVSTSELRCLIIFLPELSSLSRSLKKNSCGIKVTMNHSESPCISVNSAHLPESNHEHTGDDKSSVPMSNKSSRVQRGLNTLTAKQSRLNRLAQGQPYGERVNRFLWFYASICFKRKCVYDM